MADFILGRLKFKWKGDWVTSTQYIIDDIVKYGGNTYVCIINHTADALFYTDLDSNAYWSLHTESFAYDSSNTATHSKIIINKIIRNHIKFKGLLISDDISMKSLKFSLEENAKKALKAGCNLILHCNGNIKEMNKLAKIVPKIDKFIQKKTSHFYNFLG